MGWSNRCHLSEQRMHSSMSMAMRSSWDAFQPSFLFRRSAHFPVIRLCKKRLHSLITSLHLSMQHQLNLQLRTSVCHFCFLTLKNYCFAQQLFVYSLNLRERRLSAMLGVILVHSSEMSCVTCNQCYLTSSDTISLVHCYCCYLQSVSIFHGLMVSLHCKKMHMIILFNCNPKLIQAQISHLLNSILRRKRPLSAGNTQPTKFSLSAFFSFYSFLPC